MKNKAKNEKNSLRLIQGGLVADERGKVSFANDFHFDGIKRFYMIENSRAGLVRAWHGHKKEAKYVLVVRGAAIIGAVAIDNWDKPSKDIKIDRFLLTAQKPTILYIPPGFANGLMSLTNDAQIMIFSTSTLEESKNDDFRFNPRYWDLPIYTDTLKKDYEGEK